MLDLRKLLVIGQNSVVRHVVQKSDASGKELNEMLATPACIELAIEASVETIDKHLPPGFISIGYSTQYTHTAPTSLGMTISVKTSIIDIDEHSVTLDIQAWDELGEVGNGQIQRMIVNRKSLLEKAKARTSFLLQRTI